MQLLTLAITNALLLTTTLTNSQNSPIDGQNGLIEEETYCLS
jgi:hypothetical protein